ncbi:MAG TPA: Si-specific NAD(P)(+) transhydrogenase, partial [Porticoccaceae bacterium]|nr:Si-specific NAD(P)(+) transhydrogenase [Porticoccaceae bacterium]
AVPEMSVVGLTEEDAVAKEIPYEVGIARFRETSRGQIMGVNEGVLKLLFNLVNKRLIGVHIIGEGATELVHIGQAVLQLGGTLDY